MRTCTTNIICIAYIFCISGFLEMLSTGIVHYINKNYIQSVVKTKKQLSTYTSITHRQLLFPFPLCVWLRAGADPGFQVRGGEAHLKKLRRAEGSAKIFGVSSVKNHDFTPKNHIFSNFRGDGPGAPLPGSAPDVHSV